MLEGPRLRQSLERVSPLEPRHTRDLFVEFRSVARASILGTSLAALFQGLAATAGLLITGVPHAIFFGVLTLFVSFIPVVGTMLVWVPAVGLLWMFNRSCRNGGYRTLPTRPAQADDTWPPTGDRVCSSYTRGDSGVGNFFISDRALERLDFSDVLFTWDCG